MSMIKLVIKKDNKVKSKALHYSEVLDLLNNRMDDLEKNLKPNSKSQNHFPCDAGIIIIDLDKKNIISIQNAFSISNLEKKAKKKLLKEYEFISLV